MSSHAVYRMPMINWPVIDTVLLDMDGTLLDLSFDNFFWLEYLPQRYAEERGLPRDEARAFLEALSDSLRGSLDWYCLDHWSTALAMDIEALKREVRGHIRFRPHTMEFLNFLKCIGKQAILVTNAHPGALELKSTASGLHQHLDRMISSHEFRLAKENEGFWHRLSAREELDLARCLFIDDSPPVLQRARAEGVGHLLQVLQPDTRLAPHEADGFPGIVHFTEIMSGETP